MNFLHHSNRYRCIISMGRIEPNQSRSYIDNCQMEISIETLGHVYGQYGMYYIIRTCPARLCSGHKQIKQDPVKISTLSRDWSIQTRDKPIPPLSNTGGYDCPLYRKFLSSILQDHSNVYIVGDMNVLNNLYAQIPIYIRSFWFDARIKIITPLIGGIVQTATPRKVKRLSTVFPERLQEHVFLRVLLCFASISRVDNMKIREHSHRVCYSFLSRAPPRAEKSLHDIVFLFTLHKNVAYICCFFPFQYSLIRITPLVTLSFFP